MTAFSTSPEASVPTIANKYFPLFELGQGGMGTVILAVVRGPGGFNKLQVVKALRPELADNPDFLTMFLDEARLSARINHAHVVQTNEVGFDGTSYFLAMEYLEGQSLEAFMLRAAKKGPLEPQVFVRILVDACAGLHHAHELLDFEGRPLNVVHRDVSPHNIFITYDGQTKVLDFGIAKAADSSAQTRTGIIKGKVAYMAPEQFRSGSVDRRADVFALGAILWRVIAGRRLWKNMTDVEVYQHLGSGEIPSPTEVNPDAPPELVAICMKALSPQPDDRHQTAAELGQALEEFLEHHPDKVSPRTIGKQVSELFTDRRAAVKTAIEERLSAGIPAAVPSMSSIPVLTSGPESSRDVSGIDSGPSASLSGRTALSHGQTTVMPGSPHALDHERPSQRRTALFLVAAVLSVVAAGVIVVRTRNARIETSALSTTEATAGSESIALAVDTDPPNAEVKLDGRTIEHKTTVKRDGALHRLSVEAPGYVPHVQMLDLATAPVMDLHVALERASATEETAPAASSAAAKRPPPIGVAAKPGKANTTAAARPSTDTPAVVSPPAPAPAPAPDKTGLDMGDPWAKKK